MHEFYIYHKMTIRLLVAIFAMMTLSQAIGSWHRTLIAWNSDLNVNSTFIFPDPSSGLMHVFGSIANTLIIHRYLNTEDSQFGSINIITGSHSHRNISAAAGSYGNTYALLVAFDRDEKGSEIFFTESFDKGKTWSEVDTIVHSNKMNITVRSNPQALFNPVSKMFHIFYNCRNADGSRSYICMVRRRMNEKKYSIEDVLGIPDGVPLKQNPSVTTTTDRPRHSYIHMAFVGKKTNGEQNVHYTKSDNNGSTWRYSKVISADKIEGNSPTSFIESNTEGDLVVVHSSYEQKSANLLIFNGLSEEWTKPTILNKSENSRLIARACKDDTEVIGLAFMYTKDSAIENVQYYDLKSKNVTMLGMPKNSYGQISQLPSMACLVDKNKKTISIVLGSIYGTLIGYDVYEMPIS